LNFLSYNNTTDTYRVVFRRDGVTSNTLSLTDNNVYGQTNFSYFPYVQNKIFHYISSFTTAGQVDIALYIWDDINNRFTLASSVLNINITGVGYLTATLPSPVLVDTGLSMIALRKISGTFSGVQYTGISGVMWRTSGGVNFYTGALLTGQTSLPTIIANSGVGSNIFFEGEVTLF
jgi:hypothetical protein